MYKAVCGSRSYNLEIEKSDYDIVVCSKGCLEPLQGRSHYIKLQPEVFVKKLLLLKKDAYDNQILFPEQFLVSSDLIRYIKENRENIISANLANLYLSYYNKSFGLSQGLEKLFSRYPKRAMYSNLFYDSLYRYATQDISFQEAFVPDGGFRNWLLEVRKGNIPIEELLKRNEELHKKAESVKSFYDKQDIKYLNKTIIDLNDILNIEVDLL